MHLLRKNSHAAESMIETLLAITVIVMATVSALSIMRTAISGNRVIEDKVVAMNLAMEGIDAVRNIRDTNYLRFYSDADECWDKINARVGFDCTTATSITNGNYFLTRNVSSAPFFEWTLRPVSTVGPRSLTDGNLDLYEIDHDGDRDFDSELYAQSGIPLAPGMPLSPTVFRSIEQARYRRILTIDLASDYSFRVTSTVTWENGGVEKSISLTETIANVY